MLKQFFLSILFIPVLFISCSKDENAKPEDPLANTIWTPSQVDENPSTNPPGGIYPDGVNIYYTWSNCNTDDSFTFQGGKVAVNNGGTECDTDIFLNLFNGLNYSYDQENKLIKLSLGFNLDVLELTDKSLKIAQTDNSGGITSKVIYVFKRR